VIGGGGSKRYDKFGPYLRLERGRIVPAQLLNEAGIIGAALAAKDLQPAAKAPRQKSAASPAQKKSVTKAKSASAKSGTKKKTAKR
jgi:polyphosphate glucokinase